MMIMMVMMVMTMVMTMMMVNNMISGLDEEHNILVNIPIVLALFSINATIRGLCSFSFTHSMFLICLMEQ